ARSKFVFLGSSEWMNAHAKPGSGMGNLWSFIIDRADLVPAGQFIGSGFFDRVAAAGRDDPSWSVPLDGQDPVHEILDETTFFDRFEDDLDGASRSLFGLVPFFGEYRWPRVQPAIAGALERGVEVTLVVPPLAEATN